MITTYDKFIDDQSCKSIIKKAERLMANLSTYNASLIKSNNEYIETQRESGHFIDYARGNRTQIFLDRTDPLMDSIRKKIAELTKFPIENQTRPLLLVYNEGDSYQNRYDYIPGVEKDGQRLKSLVIYLNDDYEGGTLYFQSHKLFVIPERGKLLIFDNTQNEFWKFKESEKFYRPGRNESAVYCSVPVREGKKFVLVIWIKEGPAPL